MTQIRQWCNKMGNLVFSKIQIPVSYLTLLFYVFLSALVYIVDYIYMTVIKEGEMKAPLLSV